MRLWNFLLRRRVHSLFVSMYCRYACSLFYDRINIIICYLTAIKTSVFSF
jgi:hypothetical protein